MATSLSAIAQMLGAEGFSNHAANEIKRYWLGRHLTPGSERRVAAAKRAFSEVVKKLTDGERIVLGKWISVLTKASFETGLRFGLMTLAVELGKEVAAKEES